MDAAERLKDLETRLYAAGLTVAAVCREAQVTPVSWWQWKTGRAKPNPRKLQSAEQAAERLLAAAKAAERFLAAARSA